MSHDPRSVLGLPDSASPRDVRRAFRKLVLELHPDRNQGDPLCNARLRKVVEAYEALTEPTSRRPKPTRRAKREASPPPPAPRVRDRYACPCCLETYAYDATCPRCEVPLVDELRAGTVRPADDVRVDAMVSELERRARSTNEWARRIVPRVPGAAIASLLAGGALALPIHVPVAAMLVAYGLFLLGAEAMQPTT